MVYLYGEITGEINTEIKSEHFYTIFTPRQIQMIHIQYCLLFVSENNHYLNTSSSSSGATFPKYSVRFTEESIF